MASCCCWPCRCRCALSPLAQPLAAFLGASAAAALVYGLALKEGRIRVSRLLLMGIGVAAGCSALMLLLAFRMSDQVYAYAVAWLSGSVAGKGWQAVQTLAPIALLLLTAALLQARRLDVLGLGDEAAAGLGLPVERQRLALMATSVALASSAVALAGGISFVGLIGPHLARQLVGPRHLQLLPASLMVGALLVLLADTAGRTLLGTLELPAGVAVALVGAPYFLYLLARSRG